MCSSFEPPRNLLVDCVIVEVSSFNPAKNQLMQSIGRFIKWPSSHDKLQKSTKFLAMVINRFKNILKSYNWALAFKDSREAKFAYHELALSLFFALCSWAWKGKIFELYESSSFLCNKYLIQSHENEKIQWISHDLMQQTESHFDGIFSPTRCRCRQWAASSVVVNEFIFFVLAW